LNILLAATFIISVLSVIYALTLGTGSDFTELVLIASAVLAVACLGIYWLNQNHSKVASTLFLILLTILLAVSDDPVEVANGRTSKFLALPIVLASMVLPPWTSFVTAGLVSLVAAYVGSTVPGFTWTPFAMFGFVVFALSSFLGARQLETALGDLREINRTLDARVLARTEELRQANEELSGANERLLELDRLKSRFVSMVSHELRTPLSAIQGFVEVLLAGIYGPLTDRQQNALGRITSNTQRLLGLVNDLLDQARIEAGELNLHIQPFAVESLLVDVHATMNVLAQSKDLTLTVESSDNLPELIYGDEARLRQILVNLINNSLKFTEKGGVAVRCHLVDGGVADPRPRWALVVSDTGPGIAPEDQAHIFQPFRRVDDSATRTQDGVGLGLAIVKELVELMEGEISLESELGKGSSFMITLPLQPYEEAGS
jgi:signal transduction histidine kinase